MQLFRLVAFLLSMSLWQAPVRPEERPNFTGTWTQDAEKSAASRLPGTSSVAGGRPMTLTMKQDAISLTRIGLGLTDTYRLDGTPTAIVRNGSTGTAIAKWVGRTLVVDVTVTETTGEVRTKAIYEMEGPWLLVTSESASGSRRFVLRNYFKKTGQPE